MLVVIIENGSTGYAERVYGPFETTVAAERVAKDVTAKDESWAIWPLLTGEED